MITTTVVSAAIFLNVKFKCYPEYLVDTRKERDHQSNIQLTVASFMEILTEGSSCIESRASESDHSSVQSSELQHNDSL